MRVKIDLSVREDASEHFHAVRRTSLGKLMPEVFRVKVCEESSKLRPTYHRRATLVERMRLCTKKLT